MSDRCRHDSLSGWLICLLALAAADPLWALWPRLPALPATLGFLQLPPREPELQLPAPLARHVDRLARDREVRELLTLALRHLRGRTMEGR